MKRSVDRNFRKIKNQISQIQEIVKHTKTNALWDHEAAIRKKLKELKGFENAEIKDYNAVRNRYLELLEYISERLVEDYNNKNNTKFRLKEIIEDNYEGFLKSGIISVLITQHIPALISSEFDRVFPANPKDEYTEARRYKRSFYLHLGDTNTGKTYNAMERLKGCNKGVYLSPLRILALENYEKLNRQGAKCNLLTGEEEIIVEGAKHVSCTIEKLNIEEEYEVAIIDEIQMIDDDQRGAARTRAILGVRCNEIHVCGSLNSKDLILRIIEDCDDEYNLREYKREIPLQIEERNFTTKKVEEGDALVVFSKKKVLELAYYFGTQGIKASLIYGDLPPEVRRAQYEQFINKESKILITTDAIGMGVNLPIKRIVFMDIKKFDGNEFRYLNSHEVKQISGRAGRKGIYDIGYVSSDTGNQEYLREMLTVEDRELREAVVGPSEAILKVKSLSLREKLALWVTREEKLPLYRKMDISEYLIILDSIKRYHLDEITEWKLMKIPFDVSNPKIMETFLNYVDELFIGKREIISKPQNLLQDLYELETYYQKINLYYSFSKVFHLEYDKQWVEEERIRVSSNINKILVSI
jgi:ATP-dependent RNA helicase SUPV3L1/SUV3